MINRKSLNCFNLNINIETSLKKNNFVEAFTFFSSLFLPITNLLIYFSIYIFCDYAVNCNLMTELSKLWMSYRSCILYSGKGLVNLFQFFYNNFNQKHSVHYNKTLIPSISIQLRLKIILPLNRKTNNSSIGKCLLNN